MSTSAMPSKAGRRSLDWTTVRSHAISRWQRPRFGRPKPNTIVRSSKSRMPPSVERGCIASPSLVAREQLAARRVAGESGGGTPACLGRGTRREAGAAPISCGRCWRDAQIVAPFDGTIAARYVDSGANVSRSTPIVRVISPASLVIRFAVPEEQAADIAVGREVMVHVASADLTGRWRDRPDRSRDRRCASDGRRRSAAGPTTAARTRFQPERSRGSCSPADPTSMAAAGRS